jgi:MFS family permease
MPTRSRTSEASPPRVAALWFGIQLAWGAILGIALQARCAQLGGANALTLFAWVATAGAIAAAVTQLVTGPWSDRICARGGNRRRFYAIGAVCGAAAIPAFFAAATPAQLIAAFIALQTALNVAIGPYQAVVPDSFPRERIAAGSAWIAAMQSAGNAIGALLAALLGSTMHLGFALSIVLLVTAIVTLTHLRTSEPPGGSPGPPPRLRRAFADLFVSRALVYVGFYTLVGYLFFFIRTAISTPLDPTRTSGLAILLFTLVGSIGAVIAARPAARFDERLVVFTGAGVTGAALLVLSALHTLPILTTAIIVAGIGWGVFLCADWALACRVLPSNAMAGAMAVWNLAILIPQMAAPPIASAILSAAGVLRTPHGPMVAIAIAGVEICSGALWILRLPYKYVGK